LITHIAARVCTNAPENSINGSDLVLEEAHYHVSAVISVWAHTCQLTYSRILIF